MIYFQQPPNAYCSGKKIRREEEICERLLCATNPRIKSHLKRKTQALITTQKNRNIYIAPHRQKVPDTNTIISIMIVPAERLRLLEQFEKLGLS